MPILKPIGAVERKGSGLQDYTTFEEHWLERLSNLIQRVFEVHGVLSQK